MIESISTKELEPLLKSNGFRLTSPRKTILRVLSNMSDHPDMVELSKRVAAVDPTIGIATVYRTVHMLKELGILAQHTFVDGRSRYETADAEHHDHMVNVRTGEIIEFRCDEIERLQEEIARQHGFRIVSHRFELYVEPLSENEGKPKRR